MSPEARALASALGLGDDPQGVLRTLEGLYRDIDAELAAGAAGLDLPCGAGCDGCCHEAVFVSAPEFFAVALAVAGWAEPERARLLTRMAEIAVEFEDELELLETIEAGAERDEVAMRVRFTCPLLASDGTCRVYAVRELNARTFGQSWDERRDEAYGCTLTHARLRVLPERPPLAGARAARQRLVAELPATARVHVYPWWFARYRAEIEAVASAQIAT